MDFENLTTDLQAKVQKAEDIAIEFLKGGLEFAPFIHFGSHKIQKLITASLDQSIDKAIKIQFSNKRVFLGDLRNALIF